MFKVSVQAPGIRDLGDAAAALVLKEFEARAGAIMVGHIQAVLGSDELGYTLSPAYAKKKPTMAGYVRYPSKTTDQPFVLTGDLYTGVYAHLEGDEIIVEVKADHGIDKAGDDYAEDMESRADYIGIGFEEIEESLAGVLLEVVFEVCDL